VLAVVELPPPTAGVRIIGKGGSAGFSRQAYDSLPDVSGSAKTVKLEDLSLRKEIPPERFEGRFELLKGINGSMPDLEKAVGESRGDE